MARIRTVKPEFWEDETIGLLSPHARLLFIGTWNLADDEGLLRWSPAYVKASLFMYDDITLEQVADCMAELTRHGVIFAYRGGKTQQQLAYVINFHRHQRINRPQPGRLPPPSLQNATVRKMYGERDKWICHLCTNEIEQLPRETEYSGLCDDLTLSIDHVIPKSAGGSDYPSNLRASHQSCNKRRCDKPLPLTEVVNDSLNDSVNDSTLARGPARAPEVEVEVEVEVEEEKTGSAKALVDSNERNRPASDTQQVFDTWNASLLPGTTRRLTTPRRKAIAARLKEFGLDDCLDAAVGWRNDPWTDRAEQNDITILFRPGNFEKMRDLARNGPPARAAPPSRSQQQLYATYQAMDQWAQEVDGSAGNGVAGHRRETQRELPRPGDQP
jgi:hypothetical protein